MHFERGKVVIAKPAVPVRLQFTSGHVLAGLIFIGNEGRVLDAIQDREYFPVKTISGTRLVRNSSIAWVEVLSYEDYTADRDAFPEVDEKYLQHHRW